MSRYDVVVIGGGAAGLSAALVLSRARRNRPRGRCRAPRNAPAAHMHGYLSRDGIAPAELLAVGRAEVTGYGGEIVDRHRHRASCRTAAAASGSSWPTGSASPRGRLLVTTGLRDELPDVPGLRERWARDVLHCPYCHGHEVRDRQLGVARRHAGRRPVRPDRAPVDPRPRLLHPSRTRSPPPSGPSCSPAASASSKAPSSSSSSTTPTGCAASRWTTAASSPATHCSSRPASYRTTHLLVGLGCDVDVDAAAGSPPTPPDAPASPGSGPPATSSTPAPRSSPPPAPALPPPSPSTPTSSTTTSATPSATSTTVHPSRHPPLRSTGTRITPGVIMSIPTSDPAPGARPGTAGPPTKHQLALMIWLAVFPDPHRPEPGPRRLARHAVAGRAHLRTRDHRGPDRHLRADAPAAPAASPPPRQGRRRASRWVTLDRYVATWPLVG